MISSPSRRPTRMLPWFGLLTVVGLMGCTPPGLVLAPEEVPGLVRYQEDGEVTVRDGDEEVKVTAKYEPELALRLTRSCNLAMNYKKENYKSEGMIGSWTGRTCDAGNLLVRYPLESLRVVDGKIGFKGDKDLNLTTSEIRTAKLRLEGYYSANHRPKFGVGIGVMGPYYFGAITGQYLPYEWLGLELGLMGNIPAKKNGKNYSLGSFSFATRFRPINIGSLFLFVGTFGNINLAAEQLVISGSTQNVEDRDFAHATSVGPRAGLDYSFINHRMMISLEFALFYTLSTGGDFHFGLDESTWKPWGGGTISYMF